MLGEKSSMVRVLHVIGKMDRGGAETMIMNYYRNIDRSKIQFDFLVHTEKKGDYDDEIIYLGGGIYRIIEYLVYNTFSYKKACSNFFKENHNYDIVHGHIGSCASIYLSEAKKYNIFTIAHSHNTKGKLEFKEIIFRIVTKNTKKIADFFCGCSLQAGIDRYGINIAESELFCVIPNAIDLEQYVYSDERHRALKKEWNLENKIIFGHVGRFEKQKNHKFLIEIFSHICKKEPSAYLILVGDGSGKNEIERLIIERGLGERVILTGIRKDISNMMNLFDLFLFPSFYEGLSVALIEAQATGLPCIISNTIDIKSVLTDNVLAISLNKTAEVWADEALTFLKSFERKNEYNRIVDANYDIKKAAEYLCDFYIVHSKG